MSIYSKKFRKQTLADKNTSLHKVYYLINNKSKSVLDIGCSSGYLGKYIKETKNIPVHGIEINSSDYKKAQNNLDKVYNIDIQKTDWQKGIKSKFDTIIFADVLEHTTNPEKVIKAAKKLLNDNGEILISVPNITHQSIIMELLAGQWNYEESGLLDKTHLHFFDQQEIVKIVENAGLYITAIDAVTTKLPKEFIKKNLAKHKIKLDTNLYTLLNRNSATIFQHIIRATIKKPIKYKTFKNTETIIKPVSGWINDYKFSVNKINQISHENENLNQKVNNMQTEIDKYYSQLNKIYHSKTWKLLGIYKTFMETSKSYLKTIIPIALRKKLKSYLSAQFTKANLVSKIPFSVRKDWKNWNYHQKNDESMDILNFSIIAWDFRFQRPQQLAKHLGKSGHRVFYIKNEFLPFRDSNTVFAPIKVELKSKNVYEITLSASRNLFIYDDTPTKKDIKIISASIKTLIKEAQIAFPIAKVDHPFWASILNTIKMPIIYDCMDNHQGFVDNNSRITELEKMLFSTSDITIVTSKYLESLAKKNNAKQITLIPNAGDFQHFSTAFDQILEIPNDIKNIPHPIIGYYGAIAEWFDTEILERTVIDNPDKSFVLIGGVTNPYVKKLASKFKNIHLLGEKSYQELPKYLKQFDICTIPFILNDLIKATHPVKIFEYLAAGKPVVATKMPEILEFEKDIFFANKTNFSQKINQALQIKNKSILNRIKIAKSNTWEERSLSLVNTINKNLIPKISIVLLSYNQPDMLKNTIDSVLTRSFYPNFELIIVDNASDQSTIRVLKKYQTFPNIKIILNSQNYGFSKGNNIGLKQSTGDYIILLNNDVLVTPGWINRLLNHYQNGVGLIGPVTNNIGNEAKIDIEYNHFEIKDLENKAFGYTSAHWGETFPNNNIAAFCWIMSKEVYKKIGDLDQSFGRGMFEDDDYCHRVRNAGYQILIADDVFIHHFGGASFKKIKSQEYQQLFEENKLKFENKWNTKWIPHQYRK